MKIIFILLCSLSAYAQPITTLDLNRIHMGSTNLEVSGLVKVQDQLYAVSDNPEDTWLYSVDLKGTRAIYKPSINIKSLDGYWNYYLKTLSSNSGGRWLKVPWDIEGVSICSDKIYIVNEQARDVLEISDNKISKLNIDLESAFKNNSMPFYKSPSNAGLEGIAIDCENQTLYLAQERSPRAIVVVNLNTLKVEKIGSTKIIKENIHPDYADLFFNNNALYVLERNMRRILKLDPKSLEVIQSVSYASLGPQLQVQDLYNTGEPYGLAEALYMSDRHIFIGLDNNRNSFSKKAKILYPLKGDHSVIIKFDRPEGF